MNEYEFAVEFGWCFEYYIVQDKTAAEATFQLVDEIFTDKERFTYTNIELVKVSPLTGEQS